MHRAERWTAVCALIRFYFCQTSIVLYASFIRLHCFGFPLISASTEQTIINNSFWLFTVWGHTMNGGSRGFRSTAGQQIICTCSFSSNWKAMRSMSNIHPGHPGTSWNKQNALQQFIIASLNTVCVVLLKMERCCEYFDGSAGDKWEGRSHNKLN